MRKTQTGLVGVGSNQKCPGVGFFQEKHYGAARAARSVSTVHNQTKTDLACGKKTKRKKNSYEWKGTKAITPNTENLGMGIVKDQK